MISTAAIKTENATKKYLAGENPFRKALIAIIKLPMIGSNTKETAS